MIASCSICENDVTKDDPLFVCSVCNVKVHQYCYGIEKKSEGWKCSPCSIGKKNFIKCLLCFQKGGALKKTECNKWVHVICALFTNGVTFSNKSTMEPINVSKVSHSNRSKICSFCYNAQGFASFCSTSKCKKRLHVTCAQKNKSVKEIVDVEDNSIRFKAYCKDHMWNDDESRRLSSEGVKNIVDKKRHKILKQKANSDDAAWILDAIKSSTPIKTNNNKRSSMCIIKKSIDSIWLLTKLNSILFFIINS